MYITEAEMKMALGRLPAPSSIFGEFFLVHIDKDRCVIFKKRRIGWAVPLNFNAFEWVLEGTLDQRNSTIEDLRVCKDQLEDANIALVESRKRVRVLEESTSELGYALRERDNLLEDVSMALEESANRQPEEPMVWDKSTDIQDVLKGLQKFTNSLCEPVERQEKVMKIIASLVNGIDVDYLITVTEWCDERCQKLNTQRAKAHAEYALAINEVKSAAEAYNNAVLDAREVWPVCIKTFGDNEGAITVEVIDE